MILTAITDLKSTVWNSVHTHLCMMTSNYTCRYLQIQDIRKDVYSNVKSIEITHRSIVFVRCISI